MDEDFVEIAVADVDVGSARVYEEGWQSWSPSAWYRLTDAPQRPTSDHQRVLGFRADGPAPEDRFQGEGLLAVFDGSSTHVIATPDPARIPTVRAHVAGERVRVSANGPVEHRTWALPGPEALARWALGRGPGAARPDPTVWCSWYQYFTEVSQDDVAENLATMGELGLAIDVVQVDDGYQSEIGDWLAPSGRFDSLPGMVERIRREGRRAGVWVAPWLVGARSELAARHPEWLVRGARAGRNWGQDLLVLDTTHPAAAAHLDAVFEAFAAMGIDYFKIDFCYAGALRGRRHVDVDAVVAYREGLRLIRGAIGEAYLVGCGAPTMASVGLVDAMRVSADTAPHVEPRNGWLTEPGQRSAVLSGRGRHWQNRRLWVADPDCLIVRPAVEQRERWAAHVLGYGGLRSCSDRLRDLDDWGLEVTRHFLGQPAGAQAKAEPG